MMSQPPKRAIAPNIAFDKKAELTELTTVQRKLFILQRIFLIKDLK